MEGRGRGEKQGGKREYLMRISGEFPIHTSTNPRQEQQLLDIIDDDDG